MIGVPVVALVLSACASTSTFDDPKVLAREQWETCAATTDSVELMEITATGKILYRDKHAAAPIERFQVCLGSIAYKQIIAGRRDAQVVIMSAYFTTDPQRVVSGIMGPFPARQNRFVLGSDAVFVYSVPGTRQRLEVRHEWFSPDGPYTISRKRYGPTAARFQSIWGSDRVLLLPSAPTGTWRLRLFIEGRSAGEYTFEVIRAKS